MYIRGFELEPYNHATSVLRYDKTGFILMSKGFWMDVDLSVHRAPTFLTFAFGGDRNAVGKLNVNIATWGLSAPFARQEFSPWPPATHTPLYDESVPV